MARGASTGYQADLDQSAGTGPTTPKPQSATGGTQLPVGGASTATSDLINKIFPINYIPLGQGPGATPPPNLRIDPIPKIGNSGTPAIQANGSPAQVPVAPGAPTKGRPGDGVGAGNRFNPFLGFGGYNRLIG